MAIQSDSYQKINWGWLNDYNGYKFAPITFFEQLYTEEGYAFKDQYDKRWSDLEQGNLVAGAATSLKYPEFEINSDNEQIITGYKFYNTGNKNFPIYFKDGVPQPCDPSLLGNINLFMPEEAKTQLQKDLQAKVVLYENSVERVKALQVARESLSSEAEIAANDAAIEKEIDNQIKYQNQLRALTTIHGGTIVGNTVIGDNFKFNKPLKIKIGTGTNSLKTITQSDSTITWTHADIGFANSSSGLLSTGEQTINGLKKFTSNIKLIEARRGYYLTTYNKDEELVEYPALYDNSNNLWIGATASSNSAHHIGRTYISAGYDDEARKGYTNVYIAIPDDDNKNATVKEIVHTGNLDNYLKSSLQSLTEDIVVNNNDIIIRHNFNRSTTLTNYDKFADSNGNHLSQSPERFFGFYDSTGDKLNEDRLSAIRSIQKNKDSSQNYRNYICMTAYNPKPATSGNSYGELYVYVDGDNYAEAGVISSKTIASGGTSTGNNIVFMGAAWNDYAEFRDQVITVEPGYCVASTDDGKVYKTTEKFQACDGIVSDTYGFAIGRSETYQTPLAVSGRVLAYCEGDRYNYHAGDTVCAGPEGKVCKMTREEIKEYPDRIIGIVSEIPEYEEWTGKKVNNRIWIKVR